MTTDDQEQGGAPPEKRKLSPKHVVVTYAGKKPKKEQAEVPAEILPQAPTQILSSFIEQEGANATKAAPGAPLAAHAEPEKAAVMPPKITLPPIHLQGEPEEIIDEIPEEPMAEEISAPPVPSASRPLSTLRGYGLLPSVALVTSVIAILAVITLTFSISNTQNSLATLEAQARSDKDSVQDLAERAQNSLAKVKHLDERNDTQQQI